MLTINDFLGLRVRFHWSVLILMFLIGNHSGNYLVTKHPDQPILAGMMGIFVAIFILFSVLAHELAHILTGRYYGISYSGITLFAFGGAAHMTSLPRTPKAEFMMTAAGPASSAVVAVICFLVALTLKALSLNGVVVNAVLWCATINLVLVIFNVVPAYPLDGGRMMHSIIWSVKGNYVRASELSLKIGFVFCCLLGVYGLYIMTESVVSGLWMIVISALIYFGGRMEVRGLVKKFGYDSNHWDQ